MSNKVLVKKEKTLLNKETELQKNELNLVFQLYHIWLYCIRIKTLFLLICWLL